MQVFPGPPRFQTSTGVNSTMPFSPQTPERQVSLKTLVVPARRFALAGGVEDGL